MTVHLLITISDSHHSTCSVRHAVRDGTGGDVALDCSPHFTGKMGAELVVGMTAEPGAQIFIGHTVGQILAQQAFNGFGDKGRRASIADGARDGASWGADLPGSPLLASKDTLSRVTVFMIPVAKWSDGTADSPDGH